MKWVRFEHDGSPRFGILQNGSITVTSLSWKEILEGRAVDSLGVIEASEVTLLAPLDRPGKIIAIGLNYMDHCRETNSEPPEKPIVFCKFPTSVVGPGDEIRWSEDLTRQVDYEVELAVVIGRTARRVSEREALNYVFGYTVGNDVSQEYRHILSAGPGHCHGRRRGVTSESGHPQPSERPDHAGQQHQ